MHNVVAPLSLILVLVACTEPEPEPEPQGLSVVLVEEVTNPVDATPSADGLDVYAITDSAVSSQLLALRSGEVTTLASFEHARAVVTDATGTVFVADTGADAVFAVDAEGIPTMVEGTDGLGARALHLGEDDRIYVAGDDGSGPAVFSVSQTGGEPTLLATGFPGFVDGIVQADDGTVYVTGEAVGGAGVEDGALFEIVDGQPVVRAEGIHLGSPAGVAITPDETTVMVSAISATGTSEVVLVSRADQSTTTFDDVIGENTDSGGLHRATNDPTVFAWADSAGSVYRLNF